MKKILVIENSGRDFEIIRRILIKRDYIVLPDSFREIDACIDPGSPIDRPISNFILQLIDENYRDIRLIICDIQIGEDMWGGNKVIEDIRSHKISEAPDWTLMVPILSMTHYHDQKMSIIKYGSNSTIVYDEVEDKDNSVFEAIVESNVRLFERQLDGLDFMRKEAFMVRIQGELQIARDIQMGMVPRAFPPFPDRGDIDLYASMTPAKEVGGDLYDYFIQNEKLYFCIGDVSGKGIPASLFMAIAKNLFRVVGRQGTQPSEIARQINETLSDGNDQLMFVTMFIGTIDLRTGDLDFCNCGHNPPVILSREGPRFLDCKPNTSIGILPGYTFKGERIPAFKDTPIFLYTDGLNEAENPDHVQFGNDRLLSVLKEAPFTTAEELVKRVYQAVVGHVGTAEASDDLTMLSMEIMS